MTAVAAKADTPYACQAISVANMASSIFGGLSLVLAVTAPLTMKVTPSGTSSDVIAVACVRGGLPFLCVVSIVLSRWFSSRGMRAMGVAIAIAPLVLVVAVLTLGIAAGYPSGVGPLFPRGEPANLEHRP